MKKIETLVKPLTQQALVGDGYYIATLMLDWRKIVGEQLSIIARPEKIIFPKKKQLLSAALEGNLHLRLNHSAFAIELSFQEALITEKVNVYFGKEVIDKITLKHGGKSLETLDFFSSTTVVTPPQISSDILKAVNQIDNIELQQALLSLAKHIKF